MRSAGAIREISMPGIPSPGPPEHSASTAASISANPTLPRMVPILSLHSPQRLPPHQDATTDV